MRKRSTCLCQLKKIKRKRCSLCVRSLVSRKSKKNGRGRKNVIPDKERIKDEISGAKKTCRNDVTEHVTGSSSA